MASLISVTTCFGELFATNRYNATLALCDLSLQNKGSRMRNIKNEDRSKICICKTEVDNTNKITQKSIKKKKFYKNKN